MTKTILITGGSQGIGKATALLAAQKRYNVIINYAQNAAAAAATVAQILEIGGTAMSIQADISKEAAVMRMFQQLDETYGAPWMHWSTTPHPVNKVFITGCGTRM